MFAPFSRRRLLARLGAGAASAGLIRAVPALAQGTDTIKGPSIAIHGEPKYKPGFTHFDYVNPSAPKGGTFYMAVTGTFDSLNPFILKGSAAAGIDSFVFATLLWPSSDEPFSYYAWVAKTIETPKDRAWVAFEIDERARFHDGSPITADDVVFSFEILVSEKAYPFYAQYYKDVAKVEKTGPLSVRFMFKSAGNKELPLILGQLAILSKADWSKREFDKVSLERPLGNGPYRIGQVNPGRYIAFDRVKDYWAADLPGIKGYDNFDTYRLDYFRDDTVRREAFKAGEYDYHAESSALAWATQFETADVREGRLVKRAIKTSVPQGLQAFACNLRRPIFADWRVRRALALLFDFEWMNKSVFYGQYTRAKSYFNNSEFAATGLPEGEELKILEPLRAQMPESVFKEPYSLPVYAGDGNIREGIRAALALLKEAGWDFKGNTLVETKTGKPFRFEAITDQQADERFFLPYAQNLKRLGIVMDFRLLDPTQYQKRVEGFDYDMINASWGQSESPGNEQRGMWHSSTADVAGSQNYLGVKDKAIDALVDLVINAPDRPQLVARTKALDRVLLHHHFVIPAWYLDSDRLLWWDKIGMAPPHSRGTSYRHWWYDAAKAAKLKGRIRSEP